MRRQNALFSHTPFLFAVPQGGEWRGSARRCDSRADPGRTVMLWVAAGSVSFCAAASAVYLYIYGRIAVGHGVRTAEPGEAVASAVVRAWMGWDALAGCAQARPPASTEPGCLLARARRRRQAATLSHRSWAQHPTPALRKSGAHLAE